MPQDELWATSARLTGYTIDCSLDPQWAGADGLTIRPRWSKNPPGDRNGYVHLEVPVFARDYVPRLIRAAHYELTGGVAKQVPSAVRHELRTVLQSFQEGALH